MAMYCLKIYALQSAGGLGLFRGTTKNRLAEIKDQDVRGFVSGINHPGPSLSTVSKIFPVLGVGVNSIFLGSIFKLKVGSDFLVSLYV